MSNTSDDSGDTGPTVSAADAVEAVALAIAERVRSKASVELGRPLYDAADEPVWLVSVAGWDLGLSPPSVGPSPVFTVCPKTGRVLGQLAVGE